MKDITVDQLKDGERGAHCGRQYVAVSLTKAGCDQCAFLSAPCDMMGIKCHHGISFKELAWGTKPEEVQSNAIPDSKVIGWMRAALADDRDMKLGIEPLDRPIHEFINDLNNCIAAGATHVNADIQVDDRDGFSYISFYAYRKLTAEDLRLAKIAELQASIEAAQLEIDKLQAPALKL